MTESKAKFIVIEGIDGSGKTTQCSRLCSFIESLDRPVTGLSEPTSGEWGIKLRKMLQSDPLPPIEEQIELFIRDRADDCERNIRPKLESGITIVMDRYFYSNAAYQGISGFTPEDIIRRNLEEGFPLPDRVYLIDINPSSAMLRINARTTGTSKTDIFEKEPFLEKVRNNYLSIMDERFLKIDGMLNSERISEILKMDYLSIAPA